MSIFQRARGAPLLLGLIALWAGCVGKGAEDSDDLRPWHVLELYLDYDFLRYPMVVGEIERVAGEEGELTRGIARFYSDEDYQDRVGDDNKLVGQDAQEIGETDVFALLDPTVALLPTAGGYPLVCARAFVVDSDLDDWAELGCLTGSLINR